MNEDYEKIQKNFHITEDIKRFENRLKNPFLKEKEIRIASEILKYLPLDGNILEIGCGEGNNYFFLRELKKNVKYTGLDFSDSKILFAWNYFKTINAVLGNGLNLQFTDNSFDLVLCRDYLHHVDFDRKKAVEEALRVAKPTARVLFFESDGSKLLNRLFRFFLPAERGNINSTPEKMLSLLSNYGKVELINIEASFAVRALGFFLGWSSNGFKHKLIISFYTIASIWEKILICLIPEKNYLYKLYIIRKNN